MTLPDLAAFDAVLLDMHGTFMFDHDRLGEDEDFHATYKALGGASLDQGAVRQAVRTCCAEMKRHYVNAAAWDRFPSLSQTLRTLPQTAALPAIERERLAEVVACHEMGDVPPPFVALLRRLAADHRLGVVSNIWADKRRWLDHFREKRILDLFEVLVFSSDGPHIKPSPALFRQALAALDLSPDRVLFVGDDPQRDIAGAAAVGLRTLLVGDTCAPGVTADWSLPSLLNLPLDTGRSGARNHGAS